MTTTPRKAGRPPGSKTVNRKTKFKAIVSILEKITPEAIEVAQTIMNDGNAKDSDRLRAAGGIVGWLLELHKASQAEEVAKYGGLQKDEEEAEEISDESAAKKFQMELVSDY